ncbi:chondrolectin-like [Antedon mediterranea]|uniref:chondrolectin-like n=1 Tax=Antedon mediterranea TaxID=105859 RepID=UPI003AF9FBC3
MFQKIFLILNIYVIAVVHCQACAEFSVGSSNYKATFVLVTDFREFKTWNELKGLCDDGYSLVSINTAAENNAILDILQENCTNGVYAIGLSRESGSDRTMPSSWNWESGETVEYLYWGSGEPNVGDNQCAFGYITNSDGRWGEGSCSDTLTDSDGYGYICEKTVPSK